MKRLLLIVCISLSIFAAGRELAPRGASPTSYPTSEPHVAFANDRFLTVWTENMENLGRHVMGAFSDASGRRITELAFPVLPSFRGETLQLVGTGDSYALFWRDHLGDTHLTDIDATGSIKRTTKLALPGHIELRIAWNGSRFFVMLRHPVRATYDAEGLLLARSGEVLRRDLPIDNQAYSFHLIANGDGFAGATSGFEGVFAYRITNDGDVTSYLVDPARFATTMVSAAGDELLIVRSLGYELLANVVTTEGVVLPRRVLATAAQPPTVLHVRRVSGAHLVSYVDSSDSHNGIATLTLQDDGTIVKASSLAGEFPPSTFVRIVTASNAQTTLAVFGQPFVYPAPVMSLSIANDMSARAPEFVSVGRSRQSQPILGSGGGRLLAAWSDVQGYAAYIRTTSLAPDAAPLSDTIAAPGYVATRDLPWNGAEYLVVESRGAEVRARRIAYDGTPIDQEPFVLGEHRNTWWMLNAAVVWAGDRWIVAWERTGDIYFATIRNGVATPAEKLAFGEMSVTRPALSFNGTTLLLAWNEEEPPVCTWFPPCISGETHAYAARLTLDGKVDAKRVAIPVAFNYSIATSGNDFLVLGGTNATTIDASTMKVIASRPVFNWAAAGDVTWNGSSYAVALRYRGIRWHLSVTHLDRSLNVVDAPRGTQTLPPDLFVAPSIVDSMVAVQEGDFVNGARAVVYRESDMPLLPAPPDAPKNVRVSPSYGGTFEVTWDESPGAELYRVTVWDPEGHIRTITDIPAGQPRRAPALYAAVRVTAFNAGGASEPHQRRRNIRR